MLSFGRLLPSGTELIPLFPYLRAGLLKGGRGGNVGISPFGQGQGWEIMKCVPCGCVCVRAHACVCLSHFYINIYQDILTKFAENVYSCEKFCTHFKNKIELNFCTEALNCQSFFILLT